MTASPKGLVLWFRNITVQVTIASCQNVWMCALFEPVHSSTGVCLIFFRHALLLFAFNITFKYHEITSLRTIFPGDNRLQRHHSIDGRWFCVGHDVSRSERLLRYRRSQLTHRRFKRVRFGIRQHECHELGRIRWRKHIFKTFDNLCVTLTLTYKVSHVLEFCMWESVVKIFDNFAVDHHLYDDDSQLLTNSSGSSSGKCVKSCIECSSWWLQSTRSKTRSNLVKLRT